MDPKKPDRGPEIVAVVVTFLVLVLIIVPTRIYTRKYIGGAIGWDDWMVLLSAAISTALSALTILETKYGAGRHSEDITPEDAMIGFKINYITQVLSIGARGALRISITLFFLRITPKTVYRRICYIMLVFNIASTISFIFLSAFQCRPPRLVWDHRGPGTCQLMETRMILAYTGSILSVMMDFVFIVLPIPMFWHVSIPKRQKILIRFILSLGTIASSAAVVKIVLLIRSQTSKDILWNTSGIGIWTIIEVNLGLIAASMPALKPLFEKVFGSIFSPNKLSYSKRRLQVLGLKNEIRATPKPGRSTGNTIVESNVPVGVISKSIDISVDVESLEAARQNVSSS